MTGDLPQPVKFHRFILCCSFEGCSDGSLVLLLDGIHTTL